MKWLRFHIASADAATEKAQAGTAKDSQEALEELAEAICRRGMGNCAVFLLESLRPLNFVGSQLMYALGPVASLLIEQPRWEKFAETLEDRQSLQRLISLIESKEHASSPRN